LGEGGGLDGVDVEYCTMRMKKKKKKKKFVNE